MHSSELVERVSMCSEPICRSVRHAHGYFVPALPIVPPAHMTIMPAGPELFSTIVPEPDKVTAAKVPNDVNAGV